MKTFRVLVLETTML